MRATLTGLTLAVILAAFVALVLFPDCSQERQGIKDAAIDKLNPTITGCELTADYNCHSEGLPIRDGPPPSPWLPAN